MKWSQTPIRVAILGLVSAGLVACAPVVDKRGYVPEEREVAAIQPGRDNKQSVIQRFGSPSTLSTFDSQSWYYISSQQQEFAFYAPETTERDVLVVHFDPKGVVTKVEKLGLEDGDDIALVERETETYGRKLTFVQQMFGNLGKFNSAAGTVFGNTTTTRRPGEL